MSTPRIYVGTYNAYNNGSLHGAWLDLEDFNGADDFWAKVNEVHAAELKARGEIEPMFQDWEDIPDRFISESHLSGAVWEEWVELDDKDRELLELYLDNVDCDGTLEKAKEADRGEYANKLDFAYAHWEEMGILESIPEDLRTYIDYEAWLRDAEIEWAEIVDTPTGVRVFNKDTR